MILRIHHVQLAIPTDGEGTPVAFYGELLGMQPVTKPAQYRRFYTEGPFGNRLETLTEDTRPANAGPADPA